tara:strand:- start:563 stop:796 length:234 start_codon:yes stop_codon:yes gene_type:complete
MSDIREILWDKQTQIKDIKSQIKYNNEHNKRLMKKWEEHYNSMTNYMIGNEEHVLSKMDFSYIIEIMKNNRPCPKID